MAISLFKKKKNIETHYSSKDIDETNPKEKTYRIYEYRLLFSPNQHPCFQSVALSNWGDL